MSNFDRGLYDRSSYDQQPHRDPDRNTSRPTTPSMAYADRGLYNRAAYDQEPHHDPSQPRKPSTMAHADRGLYNRSYDEQPHLDSNPWASETSPNPQNNSINPETRFGNEHAAPPGPPPGHAGTTTTAFREADFVPEEERSEQREAMQQFEINQSGHESQQDRDVALLQTEFPGVDGSLIAAIHADSGDMGATREMLGELAAQAQAGG